MDENYNAYSFYGLFKDCITLNSAEYLKLQNILVPHCYESMFSGCTLLKQAPALPATTLAESCYESMFEGCTSLIKMDVSFTKWHETATLNWLNEVSENGNFIKFE
jgi:hypothetical protein